MYMIMQGGSGGKLRKDLPESEALLIAIRAKCMDCSGNSRKMVEKCGIRDCPLHPYRTAETVGEGRRASAMPDGQTSLYEQLAVSC